MVEFCRRCGGSLARGDLTFWMGEMFTSSDYLCPFCGKSANPEGPKHERAAPEVPSADMDIVFNRGKTETRPASPENG
jgi:hypothetical protein